MSREKKENIATILAALRMFQKEYLDMDSQYIRYDWPEHFTDSNGQVIQPLSTEDIDTLCEQINMEGRI